MGEREANGKFGKGNQVAKGNKGGPGRLPRPREEQYLAILLKTCTPEDWQKIVVSAITHAKAGDSRAREWLSNYILGKAVERHEVTFGDSDIDAAIEAELARLAANRKVEDAGPAAGTCHCGDVAG